MQGLFGKQINSVGMEDLQAQTEINDQYSSRTSMQQVGETPQKKLYIKKKSQIHFMNAEPDHKPSAGTARCLHILEKIPMEFSLVSIF